MSLIKTTAVLTGLLAALGNCVPLFSHNHHGHLHHQARALETEPKLLNLAPVVARKVPTHRLSPVGECGGSSGYGCADGFCCSKWGYCGKGDLYCGSGDEVVNSTSTSGSQPDPGKVLSWSAGPWQSLRPKPTSSAWHQPSAPAYSSPAEKSTAAPSVTSPASSAPAQPQSSAETQPSSSAEAPPSYSTSSPSPSSNPSSGGSGAGNQYKMYTGSGASSAGWPSIDQWADFDSLWSANEPTIKISCAQFSQENPSDAEVADIKSAIQSVGKSSGVDERFILAIMMQESKGCVRAPTTSYSHDNPGLFQSFAGDGTCNKQGTGTVPCPSSEITLMVQDGVTGTKQGPGLKQNMAQCPSSGAQKYYEAARIFNAGSLKGEDLGATGATQCYCSDVANRLTGWTTATTGCTL